MFVCVRYAALGKCVRRDDKNNKNKNTNASLKLASSRDFRHCRRVVIYLKNPTDDE